MKSLRHKELEGIKEALCLTGGKTRHNDEAEYVGKLLKTNMDIHGFTFYVSG